MAVYKPTDCSPYNGTFDTGDVTTTTPVFIRCKIDTSNTVITGYSIKVYDETGAEKFPTSIPQTLNDAITYLPNLKLYVDGTFSKYAGDNTGVNGTYITIPFIVNTVATQATVSRNQVVAGETLTNNHTYFWEITLYQEVTCSGSTITLPTDERYYDMPMSTGAFMGSNNERIQTVPVNDDVVVVDKYIQPVRLSNLSVSDDDNPIGWTNTDGSITPVGTRVLINNYDSERGYIIPATSGDNVLLPNNIMPTPTGANAFQIYKNGNVADNLSSTDKVDFITDLAINETEVVLSLRTYGTWTWTSQTSNPSASYWKQVVSDPYDTMKFVDDTHSVSAGSTRVIFNHCEKDAVTTGSGADLTYLGSPYNGIFYISNQEIKQNDGKVYSGAVASGKADFNLYYQTHLTQEPHPTLYYMSGEQEVPITNYNAGTEDNYVKVAVTGVPNDTILYFKCNKYTNTWSRVPDADNWGELANKVVLNNTNNQNYQISTDGVYGTINSTPFKFVYEKPERLYSSVGDLTTESPISPTGLSSPYVLTLADTAGEIVSITPVNETTPLSPMVYSHEVGTEYIVLKVTSVATSYEVKYYPYSEVADHNTTGLIFYNRNADDSTSPATTGKVYIRPYTGLDRNMILKEINKESPEWITITKVNKTYWFVNYASINNRRTGDTYDFTIGDRYQIKSFYRTSDLNPFNLSGKPTVTVSMGNTSMQENTTVEVTSRDVTFSATYTASNSNYVQWKSFQWTLYDSDDTVHEMSPETFSGEISHTFYGLDAASSYRLQLVVQTNLGYIIEKNYTLTTNFTETKQSHTDAVIAFNEGTCAVEITALLAPVGSTVYRREVWYDQYAIPTAQHSHWVRMGSISGALKFIDYSVLNHRTYEYMVSYPRENTGYSVILLTTSTNWLGWSLTELTANGDNFSSSDKNVWRFKYNISPGEFTQNLAKNQQETLSRFPRFSQGMRNAISGSVSCLLGREVVSANYLTTKKSYEHDQNDLTWKDKTVPLYNDRGYMESLNRYSSTVPVSATSLGFHDLTSNQSVDMLGKWREMCYSGNPKLLRDEKGQGFLVQINSSSSSVNETWYRMPTTISFNWTEVDNLKERVVSGTKAFEVATFTDGVSLTWSELKEAASGVKYGYDASKLTDTTIGINAFKDCTSIVSITLPNSLESIGSSAFQGCTVLISVTIPSSVTAIGEHVFEGSENLSSIAIPNSIQSISYSAFKDCASLTSITIPTSVTSIGNYAFSGCTSLSSITIPNGVTSIGDYAFFDCTSLTSVTVPDRTTTIGLFAFANCPIETATIPARACTDIKNSVLKTVVVTSGTTIDNEVFKGCTSLTSVALPNSLTSIGYEAFYSCTGLSSITIPNSVTSIGRAAFDGCVGLTAVTFGSSITSIGYYAFGGCTRLTSITIPDSVESIGDSAFSGCTRLESLTLPFVGNTISGTSDTHFGFIFGAPDYSYNQSYVPSSLKTVTIINAESIDTYAFVECDSLTSIVIGNRVTSIGQQAFWGCTGLTSVTIGSGVTSIGQSAFYGCSSLDSITVQAVNPPTLGNDALYGTTNLNSIYVPSDSVNDYKTASGWSGYSPIIQAIPS